MEEYKNLVALLASMKRVAVAFSGGVDSTLLAYAAKEALGMEALAITLALYSTPASELEEAEDFCKEYGIRHIGLTFNEFEIEGFSNNPPNRCYICKKAIFTKMSELALSEGIDILVDGSNVDDAYDYRPGMKALEELSIRSPLKEVGFTKAKIRETLKELGIKAHTKPSAACLSSRFAYGEEITPDKLAMVEAAEVFLLNKGFITGLRVRIHGMIARIELTEDDFHKLESSTLRKEIAKKFKELGFEYTTVDILGYRMGSMNEILRR